IEQLANRIGLSCRDYIIIRLVLLQHKPHGFRELRCIAPIPLSVEVAEKELISQSQLDRGRRAGHLARDECLVPTGALVVEQYPVAGEHPIALTIVDGDPVGIEFGHRVWAAWIEWRRFALRDLLG